VIRQPHPHQVAENTESTARQYALVDRATAWGWPPDRVIVIDEDQGQSAQSIANRLGFQRLLAEISLDHVGLILGLEMSRLARSNKDWHQLLELCAIFGTLLADTDGLYDPTDYNDRLLLGLRGMMNEAELYMLKGRMHEGRRHKAKRGELLNNPPLGYVRGVDGDYHVDPDEQAQHVVRLIFEVFEQQGSLHGLLRYLVAHDIQLPIRPLKGANRGQLEWHRPNRTTLHSMLHHPIYAGAYRWGYRTIDPRKQQPGRRHTGRTINPIDSCEVLIKDRFPAYISWEQFEAIQQRLANNRNLAEAQGAPREGASLLSGLLQCGRCGRRLLTAYSGRANRLRYACTSAKLGYGGPRCLSLAGRFLDDFIVSQLMVVLEPASLELSLEAEQALRAERDRLKQHWQQRLERARYEAERAARQYHAVEPDNRLVGRELERQWETALRHEQLEQEAYARFCRDQPADLTSREREAIRRLAHDLPSLWTSSQTTAQDRQEIVRLLIDEITIEIEGDSEWVALTLRWAGGVQSQHRMTRPVARYEQLSTYPQLVARIQALQRVHTSFERIAEQLNLEGFYPPRRTDRFNGIMVSRLLKQMEPSDSGAQATLAPDLLEPNEYWLSDLARQLKMPCVTLHKWQKAGWVHSRKVVEGGGRVALWVDVDERERLMQLRHYQRQWPHNRYPAVLTTPKTRN
jgi:DNA invertase Pin-like site-specific DNA recombinase